MDPKVYSKLLRLHWRCYGVDVEALRDRFPLRQSGGKAPRWDLTGTEGCGGGNRVSCCSSMFSRYASLYRRRRSVRRATRGPREWGGGALLPRGLLVSFLTSTPSLLDHVCSKNHAPEGFILFGFHLIFLFCETLK